MSVLCVAVATDFSSRADRAIDRGLQIARDTGAPIRFIHAVRDGAVGDGAVDEVHRAELGRAELGRAELDRRMVACTGVKRGSSKSPNDNYPA